MLKFLKVVLALAIFITCFAIAFAGFYIYLRLNKPGGSLLGSGSPSASAETSAPAQSAGGGSDVASLVEEYRAKNQPKPVAAGAGAAEGSAGASEAVAAATPVAAKPIKTPDGSETLIREWPTGRKYVALTFDDGPHPTFTQKFIDLLKSKNVRATFYLMGPQITANPEIAQNLAAAGFELGNHTSNHKQLSSLSPDKIREELESTSNAIKEVTGVEVTTMRPPYGSANKKVQEICKELGLKIITWNIDTDDWRKTTNEAKMTSNVLDNVKDGSIILMHDRYDKSLATTEKVIDALHAQGYTFVTISELLGLKEPGVTVASAPPAVAPEPAKQAAAAPASSPAAKLPAPSASNAGAEAITAAPKVQEFGAPAGSGSDSAAKLQQTKLPSVSAEKITRP